jgi:hypothetical protein
MDNVSAPDINKIDNHAANSMVSLLPYFDGGSLLVNGALNFQMVTSKVNETRQTMVGEIIDCYRNLNQFNMFSIRQRTGPFKGKVTGLAQTVVLENPQCVVSSAGRNRVLTQKVKNVHSTIKGRFVNCFDHVADINKIPDPIFASYAPYFGPTFFICHPSSFGNKVQYMRDMKPSDIKRFAIVSRNGVIFSDLDYKGSKLEKPARHNDAKTTQIPMFENME